MLGVLRLNGFTPNIDLTFLTFFVRPLIVLENLKYNPKMIKWDNETVSPKEYAKSLLIEELETISDGFSIDRDFEMTEPEIKLVLKELKKLVFEIKEVLTNGRGEPTKDPESLGRPREP